MAELSVLPLLIKYPFHLIDFCSSTLELHDTWYLHAIFGHIMRVLSRPCHRTLDRKSQKHAARRPDGSRDMSNNIIVLATDTAKKSWALPGSYLHGSTSPILLHHVSWKNVSSYCIYKNPKTYFVNMVAMNFRFCCKYCYFRSSHSLCDQHANPSCLQNLLPHKFLQQGILIMLQKFGPCNNNLLYGITDNYWIYNCKTNMHEHSTMNSSRQ